MKKFLIGLFALVLFAAGAAQAQLRIDVTRANIEPMPIAISPFFAASAQNQ